MRRLGPLHDVITHTEALTTPKIRMPRAVLLKHDVHAGGGQSATSSSWHTAHRPASHPRQRRPTRVRNRPSSLCLAPRGPRRRFDHRAGGQIHEPPHARQGKADTRGLAAGCGIARPGSPGYPASRSLCHPAASRTTSPAPAFQAQCSSSRPLCESSRSPSTPAGVPGLGNSRPYERSAGESLGCTPAAQLFIACWQEPSVSKACRMNIESVTVGGYSRSRCSGRCASVTSISSGPVKRLKKHRGTGASASADPISMLLLNQTPLYAHSRLASRSVEWVLGNKHPTNPGPAFSYLSNPWAQRRSCAAA